MGLLNVGARALMANQVALQTAGNNIANVNTPGYSRQSVALQTVQGQFSGAGYIGQGVDVRTILRNQSELLTRQAAAAGSVSAGDTVRAQRLSQLQEIFSGGPTGLGAAINDMMNAFSDVVAAPTDLSARTLVLTRMDETASRMRTSADRINEIQYTVTEELKNSANTVNSLAKQMAAINEQIARATGNGQTPNDLLDQREQVIREINQYVQTTQIPADDGTIGLFVGGSQPLVLGTTATEVAVGDSGTFPSSGQVNSGQVKLLFTRPGSPKIELDENMLGGGSISGLLRFNNTDLAEGRNLLGRMALAIGRSINYQQGMGLTLDGEKGKPLFSEPKSALGYTSGIAEGIIDFQTPLGTSQFAASDYEVRFTSPPGGQIIRLSDNTTTNVLDFTDPAGVMMDGLTFKFTAAGTLNERVLFKPFADAAANIQALVYSPRDLAAANPVNAAMDPSNGGTLQLAELKTTGAHWKTTGTPPVFVDPPEIISNGVVADITLDPQTIPSQITLKYEQDKGGFIISGTSERPLNVPPPDTYVAGTTVVPYTSGQAIRLNGWSITLKGTPKDGDIVTVGDAKLDGDYYTRNAGNATALMNLRDVKMFDESTLSDGYASAMAQVGTRTQSALFASDLSKSIAVNLENDRTAVSGVNLDEEAAKLLQYQQAYQASAKMLQIAQSVFDTLIQNLGR
ncbi:flagellar hook-associated protein 1 FlgK [Acidovorax temperans]|uniref:Flagellar hook-associated protein 1 n=1 Tax=Acidovorax temperans TaxID=80878 RepID=A0A543L8I3_9BURK|nr:flagellar hook-associated protein FlgK [Acidovorax temperans]TQN03613.1 flagellar hook-associated protein 1 FlgK [Acidovorax temperans]